MSTSQVNVRLDRKLAERARATAAERSSSLGSLIAVALERELAESAPTDSVRAVLDSVQAELLALTLTVGRLAETIEMSQASVADAAKDLPVPAEG
jgi:hypothetical protein